MFLRVMIFSFKSSHFHFSQGDEEKAGGVHSYFFKDPSQKSHVFLHFTSILLELSI